MSDSRYVCKHFRGEWFFASDFLSERLANESIRGPVNVAVALTVTTKDGAERRWARCGRTARRSRGAPRIEGAARPSR